MLPPSRAFFPDAAVRLLPAPDHHLRQAPGYFPRVTVKVLAPFREFLDRSQDLAVNVELKLVVRSVSDADGLRALVAGEMIERRFVDAGLAEDVVENLQIRLGELALRRAASPRMRRLHFESAIVKRADGERSVAQPAVAVVPVAHAADFFRQRCRRRSDDRT